MGQGGAVMVTVSAAELKMSELEAEIVRMKEVNLENTRLREEIEVNLENVTRRDAERSEPREHATEGR